MPPAGVDTCEVTTLWDVVAESDARVAGDLTMTIDGYPPEVAAQLGTGGEYDVVDLKDRVPDPWGRSVSWSAPGDIIPGFDLPAAVRTPAGLIELTSPMPGAAEVVQRDAMIIRWNGLGSDPLFVFLEADGFSLTCLVTDDGEFTVPESALSHGVTPSDAMLLIRRQDLRFYEIAPDQWLRTRAHVKVSSNFTVE